jgi:hypothetical protein
VRVSINETVDIPAEVVDQASFRRWARSNSFPERGRFAWLNGLVWVDLSMEKIYSHGRAKMQFSIVLGGLIESGGLGLFLADRTLLTHTGAGLSVEPDGLFVSYAALQGGRVQRIEAASEDDYVEFDGSADMVLEVVSASSVRKDTVDLPKRYFEAGVTEYWLVDARKSPVRFDLFKRGAKKYTATRRQAGGWLRSEVFSRSFRLTAQTDPLGDPQYTLAARD